MTHSMRRMLGFTVGGVFLFLFFLAPLYGYLMESFWPETPLLNAIPAQTITLSDLPVRSVISPDGDYVIVYDDSTLVVYNTISWRIETKMNMDSGLRRVCYGADGHHIALETSAGREIWDTKTWEVLYKEENADSLSIVLPSSQGFAKAKTQVEGDDWALIVQSWPYRQQFAKLNAPEERPLWTMDITPHLIAMYHHDQKKITITEIKTGRIVDTLLAKRPDKIKLSPNGRYLAQIYNGAVRVYDRWSNEEKYYGQRIIFGEPAGIFSADSNYVLIAGNGNVKMIELATGEVRLDLATRFHMVRSLELSKDNKLLTITDADERSVTVYRIG